ncbi:MAG: nucleotidyltransferase family protein, partial [Hyphomicrobiales bacterium]
VMNGDILCDLDYGAFYRHHVEGGHEVSVSAFRRDVKIDFGVLGYDEAGHLTSFNEKPTYHFDVSMGIYCIGRSVIERLEQGMPYGFDTLMNDGLKGASAVHIQPFQGYWLDIGRPEDYQYADENFDELAGRLGLKV